METQYWEIGKHDQEKAFHAAWSLSGMEAHLEELHQEPREVRYIGSTEDDEGNITDYYKDTEGWYWYDKRYRMPDGAIVPMEVKIFGRGFFEREKKRRRKRHAYYEGEG